MLIKILKNDRDKCYNERYNYLNVCSFGDGKDFAEQARKAALAMKEDIMGVVGKITL